MNFEFSEEQEQLRAEVRRFLEERAPLAWVRERLAGADPGADAAWQGLVAMGLPGLRAPAACGGSDLGLLELGVVQEELGRALHPGLFAASALGAVEILRELGDSRWLPAVADGGRIGTLAVYEPGRRWDWSPPETRAEAGPEGARLRGEKTWVPELAAADLLLVVARDAEGCGVYAVPAAAPGVTREALDHADPTRRWGRLRLDGAPAERLAAGDASAAVAAALDRITTGWVADGVGAAARALELATAHARDRVQFDRPVGSFQAVQHLLVDMLRDLELGRAGAYYALWACDAAPPAERRRAAAMAKAWSSEAFPRIGAGAIQVFGGLGFTWEADVQLYYKRLLGLAHAFGDAGAHLDTLAGIALAARPEVD